MKNRLSAYRMIEVWKKKSEHLNPDSPVVAAVTNWLYELQAMEQEDDRVAEMEEQEANESADYQRHQYPDDDIPF